MYEVDQYTVSLLHFEDGLKDECGKVWAANGGATVSAVQSKFGGSSLYANGNNQSITIPANSDFNVGSEDFTVECWIKRMGMNSRQFIYGQGDDKGQNISGGLSSILINPDNTIRGAICSGATAYMALTTATITDQNWHHIALVRYGNTLTLYIDGKNCATQDVTGITANSSVNKFSIGTTGEYAGDYFNGYIDEFRISKIARWTSDFDPNPTLGKAILIVTMSDEIQKEYELTKIQINDFITWYNNRAAGTGLPHYTFNKSFNLGPFQSRKDYLVFDKIQNFEVLEYAK